MPIRALLMDIDDTLFDFQTSSRNALSIAFRALNLPFTPEMWERYRTLDAELWQRFERGEITKEALYVERFRVFFAEYGLEADPAAFNAAYFRELGDQCNFMPHCEQALRQLHAQGRKLAIVSNKPDSAVKQLCAYYFPGIFARGEDADCPRKPAPDMLYQAMRAVGADGCIYVGDSDVDITTAKNAGVPCLSVLWGFRDRDFLRTSGATHFCADPRDLPEVIEKMGAEYGK